MNLAYDELLKRERERDNSRLPPPVCTDDPGSGQIYTCCDYNCPIHGKRNLEMDGFKSGRQQ